MVAWRVAKSLDRLLAQLNAFAPRRSKASDGSIGDATHATRASDHNPHYVLNGQALVTARDFTHDPADGLDCQWLADTLARSRDPRIKYVIWNRRIMSGAGGPSSWAWRPYDGTNAHTKHLHLSVVADARCEDGRDWTLRDASPSRATVRRGSVGPDVELLQRFLGVAKVGDSGYGVFGNVTESAVIKYQRMQGLTADGICGPATWAKIGL